MMTPQEYREGLDRIHEHRFPNMREVRRYNEATGHHFFEPDTLRFFGSRIGSELFAGRYFITSERDEGPFPAWDGERRYTIREARTDGTIGDCGGFGAFDTRADAMREIRKLVKAWEGENR